MKDLVVQYNYGNKVAKLILGIYYDSSCKKEINYQEKFHEQSNNTYKKTDFNSFAIYAYRGILPYGM